MIWILILAVIVWLLFKFAKEHNEHIQTHVTNYGGMDEKYSVLIEFLQGAGMHITKLGTSSIELKNKAESANCVMYYIRYTFRNLVYYEYAAVRIPEKEMGIP